MATKKPLTHKDLVDLLGRALKDPAFREKIQQSPSRTLDEEGFEPNPAAVDFFVSLSSGGFDHAVRQINVKGENDPIDRAGDC